MKQWQSTRDRTDETTWFRGREDRQLRRDGSREQAKGERPMSFPELLPPANFKQRLSVVSLLGRLAANPGHPEQALLAHLGDVQDPEDLPP